MKGEYPERVGQPECQVSMITDSSVLQNMSNRSFSCGNVFLVDSAMYGHWLTDWVLVLVGWF